MSESFKSLQDDILKFEKMVLTKLDRMDVIRLVSLHRATLQTLDKVFDAGYSDGWADPHVIESLKSELVLTIKDLLGIEIDE